MFIIIDTIYENSNCVNNYINNNYFICSKVHKKQQLHKRQQNRATNYFFENPISININHFIKHFKYYMNYLIAIKKEIKMYHQKAKKQTNKQTSPPSKNTTIKN